MTNERKSYRVTAIIKYHEDVGVFEAETKEEAYRLASISDRYDRISRASRGGVWDLEIEAVTALERVDSDVGVPMDKREMQP